MLVVVVVGDDDVVDAVFVVLVVLLSLLVPAHLCRFSRVALFLLSKVSKLSIEVG